jgi:drug/metabolite transporter (DMT)-like permease
VTTVAALLIWSFALGKGPELGRTAVRVRGISKWFLLAGFLGGPMAHFGSYVALGYIGPMFAAIATLMFPIFGAVLARVWYAEKITPRAALGIAVILGGGVAVYAPGMLRELSGVAEEGAWIGYVAGLVAAVGWGVEGAVAGRALDVSDPDVGATLRFIGELGYWLLLIVPGLILFTDYPVWSLVVGSLWGWPLVWLLLLGLAFGFSYSTWYKAFPLIGVGRGTAVASLYAIFAVAFVSLFTLTLPEWNFLVGLALSVTGATIMFTERSEVMEVIRAVKKAPAASDPAVSQAANRD